MRLTLDLDGVTATKTIQKANLLKVMFSESSVYYRTSSSGKGGHVCLQNVDIKQEDAYQIRSILGDDPKRICKDISRLRFNIPSQILFDIKTKQGIARRSTEWIRA